MFKIDCSGENPVVCDSVGAARLHVSGALARGVRGVTVTGLDGRPFRPRLVDGKLDWPEPMPKVRVKAKPRAKARAKGRR